MAKNKTYDEISVGDSAEIVRRLDPNDLVVFAHASGNFNPVHLPEGEDQTDPNKVAPSMWIGSLFSAVLGNVLPGVGTLYKSQNLTFRGRAHLGEEVTVKVTAREKLLDRVVVFDCLATLEDGTVVAEGAAEVIAPSQPMESNIEPPDLILHRHRKFDRLLAACKAADPMATAVVCPTDANSLGGAKLAYEEGLITPIFLGSAAAIQSAADELSFDISGFEMFDTDDDHAACAQAVAMVHEGRAQTIMKGNVHSDELLGQVAKRDGGLRTGRRLSHVFVMDVPGMDHLLFVSDAAINILPDLQTKVDIVQNSINLALACGLKEPSVGILSAVETVNPKIPSTLDAAVLAKMADRGQIKGGVVDGPLAMDNAIDMEAARTKGIRSMVAGHADVLIVPNLEAGNMLAKELTFVARADAAGLVVGARVPIILTSRSDNAMARLASTALAHLASHYTKHGVAAVAEEA